MLPTGSILFCIFLLFLSLQAEKLDVIGFHSVQIRLRRQPVDAHIIILALSMVRRAHLASARCLLMVF